MRKQKGFSLIELLIVVAIILIIAAIAIPNLLRARMSANEASAVGSLRTLNTAEVTYNTSYNGVFATLTQLGPADATCSAGASASNACLIDNVLANAAASPGKSGYLFTIDASVNTTYTSNADPVVFGQTGARHFFSDPSGVIRSENTNTAATAASNPI
jgi:prepilin-type N-terminal cleavage/methylation domain-containing protein